MLLTAINSYYQLLPAITRAILPYSYPGYECNSPIAPSVFDRLVEGYRLIIVWGYRTIGGPLLYVVALEDFVGYPLGSVLKYHV